MNEKFTPGPWEVDYGFTDGHIKTLAFKKSNGSTPTLCRYKNFGVAGVTQEDIRIVTGISEEEETANAHLISAAPDMYEALIAIEESCADAFTDEYSHNSGHYTASVCPLCSGSYDCDDDCPRRLIKPALKKARGEK